VTTTPTEGGAERIDAKLADYAVAFACLADLALAHTEAEAVDRIVDLFRMLCAPGRVVFVPGDGSAEHHAPARPTAAAPEGFPLLGNHESWAVAPSAEGFAVRIQDADGPLGVVHVDAVARPDRLRDYVNLALGMVGMCALAVRNARNHERLANALADLQRTMAELKTLRGLLPICAGCKRIRDDAGAWSQVEVYVTKHSDATFSHGICPACMKELYGIEP
jgi:hypothetical protein